MNFIAGILFMSLEDEYEAFIALVYIMEVFKWRYLYLEDNPKLKNLMSSLQITLQKTSPHVY